MNAIPALRKELVINEAERCLLCYDAPCSKACPNKCAPADFIKSLHFENERGAVKQVKDKGVSLTCINQCEGRYCERACIRGKLDTAVAVKEIHEYLAAVAEKGGEAYE